MPIYEIIENRTWVGRWIIDLVIDPEKEGIAKAKKGNIAIIGNDIHCSIIGKVYVVGGGSYYVVYIDSPNPITAFKNGVNKISKFKLEEKKGGKRN